MKVYIVRHGDREKGKFYNELLRHEDQPLSEEGVLKARKLVNYFKDKDIRRIYISEYLRTYLTARYVAEDKNLTVIKDGRLNEIDSGVIEGMTDEKIQEKYPEFWKDFWEHAIDCRFPEGENGEEVRERQNSLLKDLLTGDGDVLLFSHEGYIRLLMCNLLGLPVFMRHRFKVDFCGIMEFEYDEKDNAWKIIRFNQSCGEKIN